MLPKVNTPLSPGSYVVKKNSKEDLSTYYEKDLFTCYEEDLHGDYEEYQNKRELKRQTPLNFATRMDRFEDVEILIKKGANIDAADIYGKRPLYYAIQNLSTEIVETLIKAGANIEAVDEDGRTPLHHAIRPLYHKNHYNDLIRGEEIVKTLIKAGANIEAVDIHGKTPLHYVAETYNIRVLCLLLSAGANAEVYDKAGDTPHELAIKCTAGEIFTRNMYNFQEHLVKVQNLQQNIILDSVLGHFLLNQEVHIDDLNYIIFEMSEFITPRPESCKISFIRR